MGTSGDGERYRVLVPQALGADEYLRVTWHPSRRVMVFSHWSGADCVAATPVRVDDLDELAALTAAAVDDGPPHCAWPAPDPGTLVVPATGFAVPALRRSA